MRTGWMMHGGAIWLLLAGLLIACGQGDSHAQGDDALLSAAEVDSADAARLERIELMYEGYRADFPEIQEVHAAALQEWVEVGGLVLIDVRRDEEREVSVISGSISRHEYEERRDEFEELRVITYCTIGYRSGRYADILRKNGIESYNLVGGILAWVHEGGQLDHDGKPSTEVHVYGRQWNLLPVGYEPIW